MVAADPLSNELQRLAQRAARGVSAARARQLRWVAGELELALGHPALPQPVPASIQQLLSPSGVQAYLELARDGELRRRTRTGDLRATDASMRIRADCLKLLGMAAAVIVDVPDRPGLPELHTPINAPSSSRLRDYLAARIVPIGPPGRIRLLAVVGVVLDTGARVGEMCAMTTADLGPGLTSLRLQRKPQARTTSTPQTEVVALSTGPRTALRDWLDIRATLVAPLQGSADALWVSVRANHAGTPDTAVTRPPGMPLHPRGMQRAYSHGVTEANAALLGTPGWQPLPHRLEQLRRAVLKAQAPTYRDLAIG